jgi:undecaprenyl diphosphate synthase
MTVDVDKENLPLHVAITMDGNGRWAQQRKLPRTSGHDEGLKTAKRIVQAASDIGIKYLTLYVFSTENWKRAEQEVGFLMNLIHTHLCGELAFYKENGIRVRHIGNFEALPANIQKDIKQAMDDTADFKGMTVNLAINYGGRDEIIRGIKKIINNKITTDQLDEKTFSTYLDMPECPDVDLLIRTGGEQRLSNYLLWHVAYAEQIYTDTLWPDYTNEEFYSHIEAFQHRNRRFGAEKPADKKGK